MLSKETKSASVANFNDVYFRIHDFIYTEGESVASRNGSTREILNFKTTLTNPLNRCVAGYQRNVNIFFLLAEAMWIFNGRRDLEFLEIFNAQMREYSDDGRYFNAPYGWRIRKYDIDALKEVNTEQDREVIESSYDQLVEVLKLLNKDPETRQAVISIWHPIFDGPYRSTKDRACNDMLMFKIRNGQLHQTIQNRSNDLNWGLPTNVMQFGFLGEAMAAILGIKYGSQTHNSQSLHLYMLRPDTTAIQSEIMNGDYTLFKQGQLQYIDLYEHMQQLPIQFNFDGVTAPEPGASVIAHKMFWVDFHLHSIIVRLLNKSKGIGFAKEEDTIFKESLKKFSYYLWYVNELLEIYVGYKSHKDHILAIEHLINLYTEAGSANYDISLLALNFFLRRLRDKDKQSYEFALTQVERLFPRYKGLHLGRL